MKRITKEDYEDEEDNYKKIEMMKRITKEDS